MQFPILNNCRLPSIRVNSLRYPEEGCENTIEIDSSIIKSWFEYFLVLSCHHYLIICINLKENYQRSPLPPELFTKQPFGIFIYLEGDNNNINNCAQELKLRKMPLLCQVIFNCFIV